MKYYLFIICFWSYLFGSAQFNLVPNSSFEIVPNCTQFTDNIYDSPPWVNPTEYGTPDLYNYCNMSSIEYLNSFQMPHTGSGFAGFYTGEQLIGLPNIYENKEYIQVELTDTMKTNEYYLIEYYLSLAEWGRYATDNLGIYFSDTAIYRVGVGFDFTVLDFPEQILPFGNPVILDTIDNFWYKVKGIYYADGTEKFMTIGNFNTDSATNYLQYLSAPINQNGLSDVAYYYVDDISVIPLDSIPGGIPAYAGPDQTIYIQDSVFIGQKISNMPANWFKLDGTPVAQNTAGVYVSPLETTTYVVTQTLNGVYSTDTVTVFVIGLGLEEEKMPSLRVYPNPSSGTITLQCDKQNLAKSEINILDVTGKIVYTDNLSFSAGKITVEPNLLNGVYWLTVSQDNKILYQERLTILK
ncbi:MAG: T9SS type A sorting domain-containing protein [Crocinitomicaceae bacterium]|nr:T9SS type A sorting domain-containing protein [Crocinitomicaceae bacterium]